MFFFSIFANTCVPTRGDCVDEDDDDLSFNCSQHPGCLERHQSAFTLLNFSLF